MAYRTWHLGIDFRFLGGSLKKLVHCDIIGFYIISLYSILQFFYFMTALAVYLSYCYGTVIDTVDEP